MAQEKPLQVTIEWEKAREVFWKRYEKQAPRMFEIQGNAGHGFQDLWKDISPVMGTEETIPISFSKDGALRTTLAGWVLIGAIGAAAAVNAINESKQLLDKEFKDFESKWESKLQTTEKRLTAVERDIGIRRPKKT
jgi:hypothetical protein